MKLSIITSLFILLTLAMGSGCGYQFRSVGEPIGMEISSLAIPLMESSSSSLGFEGDFTKIIRDEFISHSKVPLVPRDEAAMVLIGKVHDIKTSPVSYKVIQKTVQGNPVDHTVDHEVTRTRRLKIRLDARLVDRTTGKVIWRDKSMEEKATFSVATDPLTNRYNQKKAMQKIAQRFAERLYLKTMERF